MVLFILYKFGIPLLITTALIISGTNSSPPESQNQAAFIAPPVLNPLPSATNSAEIVISGVSAPKQTIDLYLNEELVNQIKTKDVGTFSFEEKLNPGENTVKVKATADSTSSEFSQTLIVSFKSAAPSLTINSPSDGQSFSKDQNTVTVSGSTDPNVKITVNGFWAITDDSNKFSYTLPLTPGENKIRVVATDQAGNKKDVELKVIYTP